MLRLFYYGANKEKVFVGKPYQQKNINRCRTQRDKLDNAYGSYRYHVWDDELGRTRC